METQVEDQNKESVQLVRFGPWTGRPQSPPKRPWQGATPQGVRAILTRDALAEHYRDWYAKWSRDLAFLTEEFLGRTFDSDLSRIKQLTRGEWMHDPFLDCHHCEIGGNYLWVQKQDHGWTVELCYPDTDPDVRILTIQDMPVLCPEAVWAARLALACYPKPPADLVWRSYW
jgi:hypothetical protein